MPPLICTQRTGCQQCELGGQQASAPAGTTRSLPRQLQLLLQVAFVLAPRCLWHITGCCGGAVALGLHCHIRPCPSDPVQPGSRSEHSWRQGEGRCQHSPPSLRSRCNKLPSCANSPTNLIRKQNMDEEGTPPAFCCPIGLDIMKDPVFLVAVRTVLQTPADMGAIRLRQIAFGWLHTTSFLTLLL